jgi:hypothetical protein
MATHNQPGDLRVNRANIYRRIGRVCFSDGAGTPGLPAPQEVEFLHGSGNLWLSFDSFEEATAWAERYKLRLATEQIYKAKRLGTWCGEFEGLPVTVNGSTPIDEAAPADTDPDDLSDAAVVGDVDNVRRETEDGNGEPKPAGVEGHAHQRGGDWRDEPSGEHPVIKQRGYDPTPTILLGPGQTYEQWYASYAERLDSEQPGWWDDDLTAMAPELVALARARRDEEDLAEVAETSGPPSYEPKRGA